MLSTSSLHVHLFFWSPCCRHATCFVQVVFVAYKASILSPYFKMNRFSIKHRMHEFTYETSIFLGHTFGVYETETGREVYSDYPTWDGRNLYFSGRHWESVSGQIPWFHGVYQPTFQKNVCHSRKPWILFPSNRRDERFPGLLFSEIWQYLFTQ